MQAQTLTVASPAHVRGAQCFKTIFNARANGHDIVNAYLLMMVSRLIFPDQLNAPRTDRAAFETTFKDRFTPLGMDAFHFIHSSPAKVYGTDGIVMSNENIVILTFRGTEFTVGWQNAINDFIKTDLNITKVQVPFLGTRAEVHRGCWNAFNEVQAEVIRSVRDHRKANQTVWVTGHSLGAAQAILAARMLKLSGIPVQGVYTFGGFRVGNQAFKAQFGIVTQRYVYALDPLPMMPDDLLLGYRHVGTTNNFHVPPLPGAGPYDSRLRLNDREIRGIGNVFDHHVQRYEAALFHHLSASQQGAVPAPALRG